MSFTQNNTPVKNPAKLSAYWLREKPIVAAALISGIFCNGLMPVINVLQGRMLDSLLAGSFAAVWHAAAVFLALVAFTQLCRFEKRRAVRQFANRTVSSMRHMVYNALLHRPEYDPAETGDLLTRAVADVDLTVEGMRKFTTEITDTGVLMLAYFIAMLRYDIPLTLAACLFVPVAALLAEKLKTVVVKWSRAARTQASEVSSLTFDRAEHAVLLRVNGREHAGDADYDAALRSLEEKSVRATVFENSMPPIYNAIAMLGVLAIILYGGRDVITGKWTVGDFSAYIAIFAAVAIKASKMAKLFNAIQRATVSWQRVRPLITDYIPADAPCTAPRTPAVLDVKNLTFTHPAAGADSAPVLQNLSFTAHAGEIIGVTGPVACGKSSLGLALTGLYPYSGSICFDGRELKEIPQAQRAACIRFSWHDPMLLSDTVSANISFGGSGSVSDVIQDVCLDADLCAMPSGLDTRIGTGGVRLSGGQQSRLSLARALYGKAPLLLLDDPFSAVDMETEEAIIGNLRRNYPDSIILLISHRLTAFPMLDHILVFHSDGTTAQGSHDALLASDPLYRRIYQLQIGAASQDAAQKGGC